MAFIEGPRGPAPNPELLLTLRHLSPSTLGHLRDFGFLRGLRPRCHGIRIAGPAVTVRIPHLDSTAVHCVLDVVEPGDVVVVDQSGDHQRACWGGGVSYAARARGVEAAIVDGAVTDLGEIDELRFPVYHRSVSALTTRILGLEGAINVPVSVAGAVVRPGDIVFGDENGVAVLDPTEVPAIVALLTEKEAREAELKRRIDAGASLAELSGARQLFEAGRMPEGG